MSGLQDKRMVDPHKVPSRTLLGTLSCPTPNELVERFMSPATAHSPPPSPAPSIAAVVNVQFMKPKKVLIFHCTQASLFLNQGGMYVRVNRAEVG